MKPLDGFMHGLNLGGWLSQCQPSKEHYDKFITEKDFEILSSWKIDHVRIPVDYNLVETKEGEYKEDGFKYIDNAITWCKKYNLHMILDLHKTYGFSFDQGEKETGFFENEKYQERFYKLWEEFAKRYAKNENMLCFELLNEVTDKSYSKTWNAIAKKCISRIRAIAPTIKILVGSYWNNSVEAVKDLDPPYDSNIVYNFHCYEPLLFTHQGAHWIPQMDTSFRTKLEIPFKVYDELNAKYINQNCAKLSTENPEGTVTPELFEKLFASAIQVAKDRNVSLYCGEFGVIDRTDPQEALKWYKMIFTTLKKYNIGHAAWSYKNMDFGWQDEWCSSILPELLENL